VGWDAWLLTIVVAILYPLIGYLRFRRLERAPGILPTRTKLRLYATIVLSQWGLLLATIATLRRRGMGLDDLGQTLGIPLLTACATGLALAGFGVLSWITFSQFAHIKESDLPSHVRRAGRILPSNDLERAAFVAVALTAGICEEILYRGWLQSFLGAWAGSMWPGVVGAAVVFGLGHAYQGRRGVLMTGLLGLGLGILRMWVGSLIPGQVLHVAIDLVNGIAVGALLVHLRTQASKDASVATVPEPGDVDASAAGPS
jgi:membrane protease YdiL (CAAX protease family)